jgi:hypothetical protein
MGRNKRQISIASWKIMEYNESNLNIVLQSIRKNLTVDLLPKYMVKRNVEGGSNGTYGHCHTASGVLYKIFGPKNVKMFRAKDDEGLYHWWVVDKDNKIIDPTHEQYTLLGKKPPYLEGKKAGMLGFSYKKRVLILYARVQVDLDLKH